jgi:NAD(P)-dependent dehydrogenase (short-subunit alcohol dehydrogenase family)
LEKLVTEHHKPVCAIVGAGPGNGAAFARRFATEGYAVAMVARSEALTGKMASEIPHAHAYVCDITSEDATVAVFAAIAAELGPVDVLIYNAGKGVWGDVEEVRSEDFEAAWRVNVFGAFVAARCVLPAMKERGAGQIVFIGATASRRGGAKTAAFASAKAAQRNLAESLARAFGPAGVHVALIIVDGVVDEPLLRASIADRPDSFFVKPDDIADTAVMLTRQRPSAWTFELEARPFGEKW